MRGTGVKAIISQSDYDLLVDVAAEPDEITSDIIESDPALSNVEKNVLVAGGAHGVYVAFGPIDHLKTLANRWRHLIKRFECVGSAAQMLQVTVRMVRDMDNSPQFHSFQLRNEPRYPLRQFNSLETIPLENPVIRKIPRSSSALAGELYVQKSLGSRRSSRQNPLSEAVVNQWMGSCASAHHS